MEKSLKISQKNDIIDLSNEFLYIGNYIKTLEQFKNQMNVEIMVKDIYQKNNIDSDYHNISIFILNACNKAVEKYKKHSEITSKIIKAINQFSSIPFTKEFPTGINQFSRKRFFYDDE